ncbi:hypothetical protein B0O99DRAFT_684001 [Bisporella sp. PMI_857]|nr:hypothetical protein B0O99DRAFT_684001 [Bisporella sp. PMI_857]
MRLLKLDTSGEFSLVQVPSYDTFPYAVLSHTWTDDQEVTYQDIINGAGKHKMGYQKIKFCSAQASRDGVQYSWIDTCCIDKSNYNELRIALTSMFRWYQNAAKCYVHLADVSMPAFDSDERPWEAAFRNSRWFTRGWTLQELIAPAIVEFYSKEGIRIGDRKSLEHIISEITTIPIMALQGSPLSEISIRERMAWADRRQTKVEEDIVYCLIGICDVSMLINYGEGKAHALRRLNITVENFSKDSTASTSIRTHRPLYADNSSRERLLPNSQEDQAKNHPFFRRKMTFLSWATAFLIIVVVVASVVSLSLGFPSRGPSWPVSLPVRQIAACECEVNIFITHQNEHNDLYIRAFYREASHWSNTRKINTTIYPAENTPLTSVCWRWDNYFEIRTFYISTNHDLTQISAKCPVDGSPCYNWGYSIDAGIKLTTAGGLAVTSPGLNILRLYAVDEDGTLLEHTYSPATGSGPLAAIIGAPKADKTSPLAVVLNNNEPSLFWFDENHKLQVSARLLTGSWTAAATLPGGPILSALPQAVSVTSSDQPEVIQAFYIAAANINTVVKQSNTWVTGVLPPLATNLSMDHGPIAAVGWGSASTRLYFVKDGRIVELSFESSSGWSFGSMPPYPY